MRMRSERQEIVEYGKKLYDSGLTKGTGGNLSVWDPDLNLMAITPSGIPYHEMREEHIVLIDVETGDIVEGKELPSSERDMHRIFYKYRDDIKAIVHAHSTYAATLACMRWDLPAVHYLVAHGGINVRCAEYATYGTVRLAKNAFKAMEDRKACLLANHGLLAGGSDLATAFSVTEEIEFCCQLYFNTKSLGEPVLLDEAEMSMMLDRFSDYGAKFEEHEEI
ncbi:MAG: L-fuculose-phosphate aldolase [Eubacteriales bacterium]|nr:L-fuculose-phosphate aldolase [Eubacteriales bacterium]MDD4323860.1 L-fuculose-phosphate aldolase [Eubacteriales bacterium]MDD4540607.1 L-fuculose-phosphate aldolase [Eubacteriales bacterium]